MPSDIPHVDEVGATSAPLLSASFFIGARCQPYSDDYMLCKQEAGGKGAAPCLKEGRRVTRCAISVLEDMNKSCAEVFKTHYECLEKQNHELYACRPAERALNKCVFDNLKLEKKVPGSDLKDPVWLKKNPGYKPDTVDADGVAAAKAAGV
ncbi:NADH dehydrogenase, alpha subcomplex, subunit 8 [Saitoella complicata NRRL Y-17804]|nr:NADH dehydrogenase, alpha subcomplex, subunit 8 [Saitoella complicata NRRL Y-17804]ODQ53193.1 NADH dehydrogenase, alpha subcomplex, subunit 8 [Saitoella complicata NRRL Y-17804]